MSASYQWNWEVRQRGANLGSGQRRFNSVPGVIEWANLDCVSRPPDQVPDFICNALKETLPFEDASLDFVALVHVLEHWELSSQDYALSECHRVLKSGGSLIIVIPDIRALAHRWLTRQISDYIYSVNLCGAYQSEEGDFHRWHHTRESLRQKLGNWKWNSVFEFEWRSIPGFNCQRDWWYFGTETTK